MKKSKVTEYMIDYLIRKHIVPEEAARQTGIAVDKLRENYTEPLDAAEFLTLCSFLKIKPETVARAVKD